LWKGFGLCAHWYTGMNNNEDFFRDNRPDDYPGMGMMTSAGQELPHPLPEDEERIPGSMREDASKWDEFTDGQRKLIVFGVLLIIILVLALLLGIGSSCGDGCGSCALCICGDKASDSDTPVDLPVISESDMLPDDAVSSGDVSSSDVSGTDIEPAADEKVEYVEVPGGFSACVHHADNEAGDGSSNGRKGFLGFLFGCTDCADSCSIDVNQSLTDPTDGPDRQQGAVLSGSDAFDNIWPAQPDDEAYLELLRSETSNISDLFMQLSQLDLAMSQHTDPQRVRDNDRFRKVSDQILNWCEAAEKYDASLLVGEDAVACNQITVQLARDLRAYIDSYPLFITGAVSGTDVIPQEDQLNAVLGDIVELYGCLNPAPVTETEAE